MQVNNNSLNLISIVSYVYLLISGRETFGDLQKDTWKYYENWFWMILTKFRIAVKPSLLFSDMRCGQNPTVLPVVFICKVWWFIYIYNMIARSQTCLWSLYLSYDQNLSNIFIVFFNFYVSSTFPCLSKWSRWLQFVCCLGLGFRSF